LKEDKMAKSKISEILEDFRKEIPGFISTEVVSLVDGISIGGGSIDSKFDSSVASAYYATVASAYIKAIEAIDPTLEPEDLLITTDKMSILLRVLGTTGYYHSLAVTNESNLGICRLVMKKVENVLVKAM
jgi:predicted regulator of Ras-like GTPase activity (Roadblock/LC7/MglB family)